MQRIIRKAAAILTACLVSAAFVVSGAADTAISAEAATYKDAGYYTLVRMVEDGDEIDLSMMEMLGMKCGLVLEDDGTGFLYMDADVSELTWEDGKIVADGDTMEYTIKDKVLTVGSEEDGMIMDFKKSNEKAPTRESVAEESSEFMEKLDAIDSIDPENMSEEDAMAFLSYLMGMQGGEGDYETPRKEVAVVGAVADLMDAIADNTTIYLLPGVYNITEWLEVNKLPEWDKYTDWEEHAEDEPGIYVSKEFDGDEAVIFNIDGLSIISLDKDDPAEIVVEPRYADVLSFVDCDDLTLDGLILGHTEEEGSCTGDVLSLNYCYDVAVRSTELYGCGAYAFTIEDCNHLQLTDCEIHDCTYGCAVIDDTDDMVVQRCNFHNCREFTMFELNESDVRFIGSTFRKLDGHLLSIDDDCSVEFILCTFDKAAKTSLEDMDNIDNIVIIDDIPKG